MTEWVLDRILDKLIQLHSLHGKVDHIMATMDDVNAKLDAQKAALDSQAAQISTNTSLLADLKQIAQGAQNGGDVSAALDQIIVKIDTNTQEAIANTQAMSDADTASAPVEATPTPVQPPVTDPTPEPTPEPPVETTPVPDPTPAA